MAGEQVQGTGTADGSFLAGPGEDDSGLDPGGGCGVGQSRCTQRLC